MVYSWLSNKFNEKCASMIVNSLEKRKVDVGQIVLKGVNSAVKTNVLDRLGYNHIQPYLSSGLSKIYNWMAPYKEVMILTVIFHNLTKFCLDKLQKKPQTLTEKITNGITGLLMPRLSTVLMASTVGLPLGYLLFKNLPNDFLQKIQNSSLGNIMNGGSEQNIGLNLAEILNAQYNNENVHPYENFNYNMFTDERDKIDSVLQKNVGRIQKNTPDFDNDSGYESEK